MKTLYRSCVTRCGFALAALCLALPALAAADMNKTLYTYFEGPETAFDPAQYSDAYSININSAIFETLLGYDYLARPQKLVPGLADLPQVLDGGRTYVFKLKPGVYFASDPAFKGQRREVTAQDVVYSLQRLVDPNLRAPWDFMFKGKVLGLDAKVDAARANKKYDYDAPLEGLQALDRYTFRIRLTRPDYNLPYIMAAPATALMAREVVEHYGDEVEAHPVGTGPYRLKSWQRRNRIVLEANPEFRGLTYQPPPGAEGITPAERAALEGKTFPRIGLIDVRIMEVPQAAFLAFDTGKLDILTRLGANYTLQVAPGGVLAKKYAARGWQAQRVNQAEISYFQFNMEDPLVGGYTPEKVALRRAIALSYNQMKGVAVIRNNQAIPAQSPLAPNITGYDPDFRNVLNRYSPARGKALLDLFGYRDCDKDGWREAPGCKALTIEYLTSTGGDSRDGEEMLYKSFKSIGVRLKIEKMPFSDLVKRRQSGKYQFAGAAWGQDYPDAENFMQLLYGPNAGPSNESRFRHAEFDKLYEQIASEPDSPARNERLRQMGRIVNAYAPWIVDVHRIRTHLAQPWLVGYKPHPNELPYWFFMDIDLEKRQSSGAGGSRR